MPDGECAERWTNLCSCPPGPCPYERTERERAIDDANERDSERRQAGWITDSAYHEREAERAFRWGAWLRGNLREAFE